MNILTKARVLILVLTTIFFTKNSIADCSNPTGSTTTSCSGTLLTPSNSAVSITGGSTYYINSGTITTLTMTSGKLVICGTVTVSTNIVWSNTNPAEIVIQSGGNLTIGSTGTPITQTISANQEGYTVLGGGILTYYGETTFNNNDTFLNIYASNSRAFFYGDVTFSTGKFINRGSVKIYQRSGAKGKFTFSTSGGNMCMESSYLEAYDIRNTASAYIFDYQGSTSSYASIYATNNIDLGWANLVNTTNNTYVKVCYATKSNDGAVNVPAGNINPVGSCTSPVPVILTLFKAKLYGDIAEIIWNTAQEVNNDYFILERSYDGINFEHVTKIKGNGNSNKMLSYFYNDSEINTSKIIYYRLKQVDYDGKYEYSNIISLSNQNENNSVEIFPNPNEFESNIYIKFNENDSENAIINIFDALGKIIYSNKIENVKPNSIYSLKDKNLYLAKGTYLIQVQTNLNIYNNKIIIH